LKKVNGTPGYWPSPTPSPHPLRWSLVNVGEPYPHVYLRHTWDRLLLLVEDAEPSIDLLAADDVLDGEAGAANEEGIDGCPDLDPEDHVGAVVGAVDVE
jgi:hypothetical protein